MEFLNNHVEITKIESEKLKEFIIKEFKNFKAEGRAPEYALDKTKTKLWDTFIETNFIKKYDYHFESFYTLFSHSFDSYSSSVDIIKSILKNEIFDKFKSLGEIQKLHNRQYDEDFNNLTFNDLVTYLLKYHNAQVTLKRLTINSELYILFYINDYYKEFTFEKFEDHVINSQLYKRIFKKFNPNTPTPIAIKKIDDWGNEIYEIDYAPIPTKEEQIHSLKEQLQKPNFELDEKLLLLHYCLVDKYGIPLTERAKLVTLIGLIENTDLFEKSSDSSTCYKKISSGYERKGSKPNTRVLMEKIINKLDSKNFNLTQQTLKRHSFKLKSEENE